MANSTKRSASQRELLSPLPDDSDSMLYLPSSTRNSAPSSSTPQSLSLVYHDPTRRHRKAVLFARAAAYFFNQTPAHLHSFSPSQRKPALRGTHALHKSKSSCDVRVEYHQVPSGDVYREKRQTLLKKAGSQQHLVPRKNMSDEKALRTKRRNTCIKTHGSLSPSARRQEDDQLDDFHQVDFTAPLLPPKLRSFSPSGAPKKRVVFFGSVDDLTTDDKKERQQPKLKNFDFGKEENEDSDSNYRMRSKHTASGKHCGRPTSVGNVRCRSPAPRYSALEAGQQQQYYIQQHSANTRGYPTTACYPPSTAEQQRFLAAHQQYTNHIAASHSSGTLSSAAASNSDNKVTTRAFINRAASVDSGLSGRCAVQGAAFNGNIVGRFNPGTQLISHYAEQPAAIPLANSGLVVHNISNNSVVINGRVYTCNAPQPYQPVHERGNAQQQRKVSQTSTHSSNASSSAVTMREKSSLTILPPQQHPQNGSSWQQQTSTLISSSDEIDEGCYEGGGGDAGRQYLRGEQSQPSESERRVADTKRNSYAANGSGGGERLTAVEDRWKAVFGQMESQRPPVFTAASYVEQLKRFALMLKDPALSAYVWLAQRQPQPTTTQSSSTLPHQQPAASSLPLPQNGSNYQYYPILPTSLHNPSSTTNRAANLLFGNNNSTTAVAAAATAKRSRSMPPAPNRLSLTGFFSTNKTQPKQTSHDSSANSIQLLRAVPVASTAATSSSSISSSRSSVLSSSHSDNQLSATLQKQTAVAANNVADRRAANAAVDSPNLSVILKRLKLDMKLSSLTAFRVEFIELDGLHWLLEILKAVQEKTKRTCGLQSLLSTTNSGGGESGRNGNNSNPQDMKSAAIDELSVLLSIKILVGMMSSNGALALPFQAACMHFINKLLACAETANQRVLLQGELEEAGLDVSSVETLANADRSCQDFNALRAVREEIYTYKSNYVDVQMLLDELKNLRQAAVQQQNGSERAASRASSSSSHSSERSITNNHPQQRPPQQAQPAMVHNNGHRNGDGGSSNNSNHQSHTNADNTNGYINHRYISASHRAPCATAETCYLDDDQVNQREKQKYSYCPTLAATAASSSAVSSSTTQSNRQIPLLTLKTSMTQYRDHQQQLQQQRLPAASAQLPYAFSPKRNRKIDDSCDAQNDSNKSVVIVQQVADLRGSTNRRRSDDDDDDFIYDEYESTHQQQLPPQQQQRPNGRQVKEDDEEYKTFIQVQPPSSINSPALNDAENSLCVVGDADVLAPTKNASATMSSSVIVETRAAGRICHRIPEEPELEQTDREHDEADEDDVEIVGGCCRTFAPQPRKGTNATKQPPAAVQQQQQHLHVRASSNSDSDSGHHSPTATSSTTSSSSSRIGDSINRPKSAGSNVLPSTVRKHGNKTTVVASTSQRFTTSSVPNPVKTEGILKSATSISSTANVQQQQRQSQSEAATLKMMEKVLNEFDKICETTDDYEPC